MQPPEEPDTPVSPIAPVSTRYSTAATTRSLVTECALIEATLDPHRAVLGPRHEGFRNHAFRMLNFARLLVPDPDGDRDQRLAVVAAFHDLPVILDGDLNYLSRAADLAERHLHVCGHPEWSEGVRLMICNHHKVRPYRGPHAAMVEAVRRADWVDASGGLLTAGLPRTYRHEVDAAFPLRPLLRPGVTLVARYAVRHPRRPLPMLRW
jgi:hypothetical protein